MAKPEPKEETLDEFVARAKSEVDKFAEEWRKGRETDPEHWPMSLPPGDWDEQFRMDGAF